MDITLGPFDLLVYLIENAQMSIEDIRISEITTQYLEYIEEMKRSDYKVLFIDYDSNFKSNASDNQHVYSRALASSIKSVDSSYNDIVIKTYPGMAQAVAAGIDSLHEADILGCVAGDDCIIIVTRDTDSAIAISHRITKLINS